MTYKWDAGAAENYAKALTNRYTEENYIDTDVLDGDQLLTATPTRQVNLLVIRSLYERWQEETRRLQSPYFDYSHPEVQYALDEFMNTLSQFMAIRQKEFEPLLTEAITNTLTLALSPKTFFQELLRNLPNFRLTVNWAENNRKYFVLYRWVFDELAKLANEKPNTYANEAIQAVNEWLDKETADEAVVETLMNELAAAVPVPDGLKQSPAYVEPEATPTPAKPSRSFFDTMIEERLSDKIKQANPAPATGFGEPITVERPIASKANQLFRDEPEILPKATPPVPEAKRVNDQHERSAATLNDRATTSSSAVTDYHRLSKIDSIRKSVSVNQRHSFVKYLFGGDVDAFIKALDEFDNVRSYAEARELLVKKYAPRYVWDVTSPEVEEFVEILKRRFSD